MCAVCAFSPLCLDLSPVGCAFFTLAPPQNAEPPTDNMSADDHVVLTCEQPTFRHPAIEA